MDERTLVLLLKTNRYLHWIERLWTKRKTFPFRLFCDDKKNCDDKPRSAKADLLWCRQKKKFVAGPASKQEVRSQLTKLAHHFRTFFSRGGLEPSLAVAFRWCFSGLAFSLVVQEANIAFSKAVSGPWYTEGVDAAWHFHIFNHTKRRRFMSWSHNGSDGHPSVELSRFASCAVGEFRSKFSQGGVDKGFEITK